MFQNAWQLLLEEIIGGKFKSLARAISLVENEVDGYEIFLQSLPTSTTPLIGITGPPGAGKSTLTDALIGEMVAGGKKVGVICVDPSSPFNLGALLGDRIRMSEWYNHPNVFIRSLATRGSLGGLHPKIIEISDIMKAAGFDYVIVETVGVGQSEIEIAGLADVTIVVLVPEAGDEIQNMKAGLMEIGQIFVVNKADRPDADLFTRNLRLTLHTAPGGNTNEPEVIKTIANTKLGIDLLYTSIKKCLLHVQSSDRKYYLLADKAYHHLQQQRMKDISRDKLFKEIKESNAQNLYSFLAKHYG